MRKLNITSTKLNSIRKTQDTPKRIPRAPAPKGQKTLEIPSAAPSLGGYP